MPSNPLSILITGAGIAGPALASFLLLSPLRSTLQITLLERSSAPRSQGQNIDIRGAGITLIRKLGLESAIRSHGTGEEGVQWVDSSNRVWAAFGASDDASSPTSDVEILRGRLADILLERCRGVSEEVVRDGRGEGVNFVFGDYVERVEEVDEKVWVTYAKSGKRKAFDIVVGADGLQSQMRRLVWGEEGEEERIKRLGLYGAYFSMPRGENDTNWRRWYHAAGRRSVMVRPGEAADRATVSASVLNEDDRRFRDVATDGRKALEAQKALMKEYLEEAGWECKRIVRQMEEAHDFYYSMVAQVKMERWNRGRVVLLGDAGYCASPISGMGTTLALTGAYNLAGAIVQHPDDLSAAFAQYEDRVRPTVDKAQKLAPVMPHIFALETSWGIWLLRAVFFLVWKSGLQQLMFKVLGPKAAASVPVEEYGLRELPDWKGYNKE